MDGKALSNRLGRVGSSWNPLGISQRVKSSLRENFDEGGHKALGTWCESSIHSDASLREVTLGCCKVLKRIEKSVRCVLLHGSRRSRVSLESKENRRRACR